MSTISVPTSTSHRPARPTAPVRIAAYGAAAWALGFAGLNVYLQAVGIDDSQIEQRWAAFTVLNLGVVALKLFGAAVALATVHTWSRRIPAWLITFLTHGAAAMLLLYATVQLLFLAVSGDLLIWITAGGTWHIPALAYLAFFAVGGGLFAIAGGAYRRRHHVDKVWVLLGALGAPLLLASVLFGSSLVL